MRRQGIFTAINILGLALGLTSFIFIGLWVLHEFSYEKMYHEPENIYQVYKSFKIGDDYDINSSLPFPLGKSLQDEFPEIKNMTRVFRKSALVSNGEIFINESRIGCVDTSFFSIFNREFIYGDPSSAFTDIQNIVITESISEKYFGNENPVGRTLTLNRKDQYVVSAVIPDIPDNTYLYYSIFIPIEDVLKNDPDKDDWYSHFISTYIVLPDDINTKALHKKLTEHIRKYMTEDKTIELVTQSITEKHLFNIMDNNKKAQYVKTFLLVGFLILIIATINYMNLATAISSKRSKEISLKKVVGANRRSLLTETFSESLLHTTFATFIALVLVETLRPLFEELTSVSVSIPNNIGFYLAIIVLIIITSLLAGAYPSLILSSYKPVDVFRGKIITGSKAVTLRKLLVIFQFTVAAALIIISFLMFSQLNYAVSKEIGFNKENLVSVPISGDLSEKYDPFMNELLKHPGVHNVCRTSQLPSHIWNIMRGITWEGNESSETHAFGFAAVDYNYIPTVGLKLTEGRNFSKEFGTDSNNYIINETAARLFGYENAIGKKMGSETFDGEIIGIVKDFHSLPLQYEIEPLILKIMPDFYWRVLIRIGPENMDATLAHIENTWNNYVPGFPFEYTFVEDRIARSYRGEGRMGKLAVAFTILAILITCIGLLGLASHMAQQKTKEVGIRKVYGASVQSVISAYVKKFASWVLISNILAWPIAYLFIKNWLSNFAYTKPISWYIFILSAALTMLIAILAVAYQSYRSAIRNPVDSLRYE